MFLFQSSRIVKRSLNQLFLLQFILIEIIAINSAGAKSGLIKREANYPKVKRGMKEARERLMQRNLRASLRNG